MNLLQSICQRHSHFRFRIFLADIGAETTLLEVLDLKLIGPLTPINTLRESIRMSKLQFSIKSYKINA